MSLRRYRIGETLMWALGVVECEVVVQPRFQQGHGGILFEIKLFVFDRSYLTERQSRSIKRLSIIRPRPSILTRTPAASTHCVKARAVNCTPWSVFKISGWLLSSASWRA